MGGSPGTWDAWFAAVPSRRPRLEFDPSHLYWQGIDHVRALREYADRVYHVHAKDTEMLPERATATASTAARSASASPATARSTGRALHLRAAEIGYDGGVAIEHEDEVYGWHTGGERLYDEGLPRGRRLLTPLVAPAA